MYVWSSLPKVHHLHAHPRLPECSWVPRRAYVALTHAAPTVPSGGTKSQTGEWTSSESAAFPSDLNVFLVEARTQLGCAIDHLRYHHRSACPCRCHRPLPPSRTHHSQLPSTPHHPPTPSHPPPLRHQPHNRHRTAHRRRTNAEMMEQRRLLSSEMADARAHAQHRRSRDSSRDGVDVAEALLAHVPRQTAQGAMFVRTRLGEALFAVGASVAHAYKARVDNGVDPPSRPAAMRANEKGWLAAETRRA